MLKFVCLDNCRCRKLFQRLHQDVFQFICLDGYAGWGGNLFVWLWQDLLQVTHVTSYKDRAKINCSNCAKIKATTYLPYFIKTS